MEPSSTEALWPTHLIALARAVRAPSSSTRRDRARERLWVLLLDVLMRFLAAHARRGSVSREDLEDLAATKSLEVLQRVESGAWDPTVRRGVEVMAYLSRVARNGLADLGRRRKRVTPADAESVNGGGTGDVARGSESPDDPASPVEAREFADALAACAAALEPRARRVWLFRACYEMSSREIAVHPEVRIRAGHVDVLVQRARQAIRDCMRSKGHEASDVPANAFVELWSRLEAVARAELAPHAGTDREPTEDRDER